MDLFSKLKKKNHTNEKGEDLKDSEDTQKIPASTKDDDFCNSIDALVDSDAEGADIFDDEDEDEVASATHTGSIHSKTSRTNDSVTAETNYTEVIQNLATSPFLSPLAARGDLSTGSFDLDINLSSRHSKQSISSKLSSKDSVVHGLSERFDELSVKSDRHNKDDDIESKTSQNDDRGSDSAEDYSDDEDEGQDGYKPGGYHPVKVGEVYNQRYVIIKKLGWGHFSTVWMVKDRKALKSGNSAPFYALKVQKSAEHYTEAAVDEVELLNCIATERKKAELKFANGASKEAAIAVDRSRFVATLHDSFFHSGPNGRHMCMVFSMLGCNLLTVIKAYNYRGIPVDAVKVMIRGVCKGLDFLHRKCQVIHTDLKPENVLLQFPHQIGKDEDFAFGVTALAMEYSHDSERNAISTSVEDLEAALNVTTLTPEERKKLKKRLKRKRQKERKQAFNSNDNSDDEDEESVSSTIQDLADEMSGNATYALSDKEFSKANGKCTEKEADLNQSHSHVKRRIERNRFLATNFGPQRLVAESDLTKIAKERIFASKANSHELQTFFEEAGESGIARISIVLRQFSSDGDLCNALNYSLGGISFDRVGQEREWPIKLSLSASESMDLTSHSYIKLSQSSPLDSADSQYFAELVNLIGENFDINEESIASELPDSTTGELPGAVEPSPFVILSLQCPASSTMVGLSFLESRLPGVAFLTYMRDDGVPNLDKLVFGHHNMKVCDHPLAMRINDTLSQPLCNKGSTIFGFDMRLIPSLKASPVFDDSGLSFALTAENEELLGMWGVRNPLEQRVQSFCGIDLSSQLINLVGPEGVRESRKLSQDTDAGFQEGEKKSPAAEIQTAPSSLDNSTNSPTPSITHVPDLKDVEMLTSCRAVIVDLGNACWTYRHFSEDIQTRQYRAPEVLIGSKYDTSADIWSLGCMVFELLTGDLLFDPRAGEDYDRDEDHLAMFQELLGQMPRRLALDGKYSKNFFDKKGNLRHIKQLKFWPMEDVLSEKYHFSRDEAVAIADFVRPLLDFDPKTRMTAEQALQSDWLQSIP
ncbi:serine/threonine-protein kinase SRPK1 [Fistulifera solaris]|uniref:non-specific serine/threonine protein kinase n=1 Tax=Fistulifera solaris TaxID=1519565 RepID=A0A1Z5J7J7_FISSO|nr:serine/threonine-protein kinase SRPK1 [Fistulifera solaris]|eukprot:GAX09950.1 serine/threonine-protein kinase SRPK1 [Fistulifera solaris]